MISKIFKIQLTLTKMFLHEMIISCNKNLIDFRVEPAKNASCRIPLQWESLNVITLRQTESDNINRMIT